MGKMYGNFEKGVDSDFYFDHVNAMTGEGLHGKSEIAAELAYRDQRIAKLEAENKRLTDQAKEFIHHEGEEGRGQYVEWQPMDTAPSGRWILVRVFYSVWMACWNAKKERFLTDGGLILFPEQTTGWMEVPKP